MTEITDIKWSSQALGAFALDSYVARVEFDDGYTTIIACPPHAARKPESEWANYVRAKARAKHHRASE